LSFTTANTGWRRCPSRRKTYDAYWDFRGDLGWQMMEFDYQQYAKNSGTRVYLVTTSTYFEDEAASDQAYGNDVVVHGAGPKTDAGAFLIYVSDDYFTGNDNAWADYQADKKAMPEIRKTAKENRRQEDLSSIE